jgi:mannose-6-phosphate isomerase-like protein (cupin superfamily)
MRLGRHVCPVVVGLVMAGVGVAFAQGAQPKADVPFASSAEIDAALPRAAANPAAVARVLPDDVYQYFVATRKQPGSAEIHTQWSDITVVRSGKGLLRTGGVIPGRQEVSPGEWRGDTTQGSVERPLSAGDLIVIPAGMVHQFSPIGRPARLPRG